jgi:hypothetical protein
MSNESQTPNQPADTTETSDIPARAMAHRRIDATCIAEMAKLVAKMLTESEAARRLGIRPRAWFDWKSRCGRTEKFAALLEAYRADRIESLIDRIEKSADGVGLKFPDWRAALALLKITDQKRFGDGPAVEVNLHAPVVDTNDPTIRAILDRAYAAKPAVEIGASVEQKQLPENATGNPT